MHRIDALCQLLCLDRMPRTGWVQRGVPIPESVAGHVLGSAHVALALAGEVTPPVDLGRLLGLVLVHDAPEALTGDLPRAAARLLPPGAKETMERGAAERLLGPLGGPAQTLWEEYARGASREARLARLCDRLQLGLRLLAYRRGGQRGLEEFAQGLATLDCTEFPAAERLRRELQEALEQAGD